MGFGAPTARRISTESPRTPLLRVHAPPSASRSNSLSPPQAEWAEATGRTGSGRHSAADALLSHQDVLRRLAKECRRGSEPVPSSADEWAGRREMSELSNEMAVTPAPTPERQSGGRPSSLLGADCCRVALPLEPPARTGSPLSLPLPTPLSPECNCNRCATMCDRSNAAAGSARDDGDANRKTEERWCGAQDEYSDAPVCALLAEGKTCSACTKQSPALRVVGVPPVHTHPLLLLSSSSLVSFTSRTISLENIRCSNTRK